MVAAQVCADVGAPYVQGRSSAASPRVRSSLRRQPLKDPPVIFQGDLVALLQLLLLRLSVHLAHVGHQLLWPQALFHLRQLSLVLLQGVDKRDTHIITFHTLGKSYTTLERWQYLEGVCSFSSDRSASLGV